MEDDIPALTIERSEDANGEGLIRLTQYDNGEVGCVVMHPLHLRYMAEKFGLVESNDPAAVRTIAQQARRIRLLADRIEHLNNWLHEHSDTRHADLTYEQTFSQASSEIAKEFLADLEPDGASRACARNAQGCADEQLALI